MHFSTWREQCHPAPDLLDRHLHAGAFLATKCQFVYERANNVASSVRSVWRQEGQYGKYLALEDLTETGTSCPICQVLKVSSASHNHFKKL